MTFILGSFVFRNLFMMLHLLNLMQQEKVYWPKSKKKTLLLYKIIKADDGITALGCEPSKFLNENSRSRSCKIVNLGEKKKLFGIKQGNGSAHAKIYWILIKCRLNLPFYALVWHTYFQAVYYPAGRGWPERKQDVENKLKIIFY